MSSLRPYPKYQKANLSWAGSVPAHWDVRRTKYVLQERNQKGFPDEPLLAATQTRGVIRKSDFETRTVVASKDLHLLKLVCVNDFVISLRSFQGGIEYARHRGIISPAYTILRPTNPHHHGYLAWLFKAAPYLSNLTLHVTGIRQVQNIDYSGLSRSSLPVPPLDEQTAIVRFLDHVDRKIRRFIQAKRRLIELLQEEKQTLIEQRVTRGMSASHTLSATNAACLDMIPASWRLTRLRSIVRRIDQGVSPQAESRKAEDAGSWGVLKSGCVNHGVFRDTEHKRLPDGFRIDPRIVVNVGDLLVSRACGSPKLVGSTGRVASLRYRLILSDKTFRLILKEQELAEFILLAMNSRYYRTQVEQAISGAEGLANNLPLSSLRDMWFAIPPIEEAAEIVASAGLETSQIESTIVSTRQQIDLLMEYRNRLLADVVTGKLDVREAAERLPLELDEFETGGEPLDYEDTEELDDETSELVSASADED
ncbi:restriction endonuclease subunit S domain-containing protein [Paludisphaera rhizosphaerae]|uniref:restriction endonuclease subunit S n=1 Tax=Paludisphaera rhizosphaerae TaxID=2711216 RepID=UPI0013EA991E|nr:restriction endonuclease subunit S [Paludisphaera rhizosphaerae]